MALSPADIDAVTRAGDDLAAAFDADDPLAWVSFYTDDAVFVGPDGTSIEGREALLELARGLRLSSVRIEPESIIGDGEIAASLGRGSWAGADGTDATRVHHAFLMVWRREADGAWRLAREMLGGDA